MNVLLERAKHRWGIWYLDLQIALLIGQLAQMQVDLEALNQERAARVVAAQQGVSFADFQRQQKGVEA